MSVTDMSLSVQRRQLIVQRDSLTGSNLVCLISYTDVDIVIIIISSLSVQR